MTADDARHELRLLEAHVRALQAQIEDERAARRKLEGAVLTAAIRLDIPRWESGELISRSYETLVGKLGDMGKARGQVISEQQEAMIRLQRRVRDLERGGEPHCQTVTGD